ncbi:MAG: hypothetical protein M1819_005760 [Sarea resinae]|nr:MAG: hypothetical protein M1819_005760 [Sarea resinae]
MDVTIFAYTLIGTSSRDAIGNNYLGWCSDNLKADGHEGGQEAFKIMSADFWAGYISGAAGIVIGNPLDLLKVRLQAGRPIVSGGESWAGQFDSAGSLVRGCLFPGPQLLPSKLIGIMVVGVTAPILGYGALNALLFVSYNRTLSAFGEDPLDPLNPWKIWAAGAVGGLATWAVSAPTELVKCRVQLGSRERSSWTVARDIWRDGGIRGLYVGGGVTSVRDAVGYGF